VIKKLEPNFGKKVSKENQLCNKWAIYIPNNKSKRISGQNLVIPPFREITAAATGK
jgi:hypothetical protein